MIFQADQQAVKKAIVTIKNILTDTEWHKPEFNSVELHVKEKVTISYRGENQLEYDIEIKDAEPMLEGSLKLNIMDLYEVIQSFDKESKELLFERDGMEFTIDDGIYDPEIITLSDSNEAVYTPPLSLPSCSLSLSKEWLANRLELSKIANRASFLPLTSSIAFLLSDTEFSIRSFNLSAMFEAKTPIEHSLNPAVFLMDKQASSRFTRYLKTVKTQEVALHFNESNFYANSEGTILCFTGEKTLNGAELVQSLNFEGMCNAEESVKETAARLKKMMALPKGVKAPIHAEVIWEDQGVLIQAGTEEATPDHPYQYLYTSLQKALAKWTGELNISRGIAENVHPLILEESDSDKITRFIFMSVAFAEPVTAEKEEEEVVKTEIKKIA